ncbi:hypothetical protein WKK05_14635 [Nostoc sp. UHCC 0302]|uniref:hypothetical protein n=1 Tax=Nostoc sp. UHCC 0302 TaxID=3134896 RepID=UPI00311CAF4B
MSVGLQMLWKRSRSVPCYLSEMFGEALDSVADFFYELLDCSIHQLQPETQNIVAEPLMGVPPERSHGFKTVEDYGKFFADIGMRPHH